MNHLFNDYERARLTQAIERNKKRIAELSQQYEDIEYLISPDIVDSERERIKQELRELREQNRCMLSFIIAIKTYKH